MKNVSFILQKKLNGILANPILNKPLQKWPSLYCASQEFQEKWVLF